MPLVDMRDMLQHAYKNKYAVGSFHLVSLNFLQGVLTAAEKSRSPVILSLAEYHTDYFEFDYFIAAVEEAARNSNVPVAIHYDHGESIESAVHAINRGCNGVMLDLSDKPLDVNILQTQQLVEMAHGCGIPVEGELGHVPGCESEDANSHLDEISFTNVAEARAYVEKTRVDFLAVSVGNIHGRSKSKPKIDWTRLKNINEALHIPLVIHGGSGLVEDQFHRLIAGGVAKINFHTSLADTASSKVLDNSRSKDMNAYSSLMHGVRESVADEAERLMRMIGAAGRAAEILIQCALWKPIEQVTVYKLTSQSQAQVEQLLMQEAQALLRIPGVRKVVAGRTLKSNGSSGFSLYLQLSHQKVVDSCASHPAYVELNKKILSQMSVDCSTTTYLSLGPSPEAHSAEQVDARPAVFAAY